jgi:hypothetical protein
VCRTLRLIRQSLKKDLQKKLNFNKVKKSIAALFFSTTSPNIVSYDNAVPLLITLDILAMCMANFPEICSLYLFNKQRPGVYDLFSVEFLHSSCPQPQMSEPIIFSQYSLQYFWPGRAEQWQPRCAHLGDVLLSGGLVCVIVMRYLLIVYSYIYYLYFTYDIFIIMFVSKLRPTFLHK